MDEFPVITTKSDFKHYFQVAYLKKFPDGVCILIRSELYKGLFKSSRRALPKWIHDNFSLCYEGLNLIAISNLEKPDKYNELFEYLDSHKISGLIAFELPHASVIVSRTNYSIFDNLFERYFGDNRIIPYDIEDKKLKFELAFVELKEYIEKYLA